MPGEGDLVETAAAQLLVAVADGHGAVRPLDDRRWRFVVGRDHDSDGRHGDRRHRRQNDRPSRDTREVDVDVDVTRAEPAAARRCQPPGALADAEEEAVAADDDDRHLDRVDGPQDHEQADAGDGERPREAPDGLARLRRRPRGAADRPSRRPRRARSRTTPSPRGRARAHRPRGRARAGRRRSCSRPRWPRRARRVSSMPERTIARATMRPITISAGDDRHGDSGLDDRSAPVARHRDRRAVEDEREKGQRRFRGSAPVPRARAARSRTGGRSGRSARPRRPGGTSLASFGAIAFSALITTMPASARSSTIEPRSRSNRSVWTSRAALLEDRLEGARVERGRDRRLEQRPRLDQLGRSLLDRLVHDPGGDDLAARRCPRAWRWRGRRTRASRGSSRARRA